MPRRPLIPIACLVLAGCGAGDDPTAVDPPANLDLSGEGSEAWYRFEGAVASDAIIARGDDFDPHGWHAAVRLNVEPTAAELAAFDAETAVGPGGSIQMGAPRGALLYLLPLPDGSDWIEVSGAVAIAGLSGNSEDAYARLGAFQLSSAQWPGSPAALVPALLSDHFGPPLTEDSATPQPVALRFQRHPEARAIGVVTEFIDERPGSPGSAQFAALRVRALGSASRTLEIAEAVLDPPAGERRARRVRCAADLVHRVGYPLPDGATLELPIETDCAGDRVDLHVAALGEDRTAEWTVQLGWSSGGVATTFATASLALEDDGDDGSAPAGWTHLSAQLPPAAAEPGALTVAVEGPGRADGRSRTVPVVASIRIRSDRRDPRPNLLLVSLDTVRADHLGAYGGDPRLSPHFDRLAARGARAGRAWSTSPYTLPSHLSLFSGQLPTVHGVQRPSQRRDRERTPLLAELLSSAGYRTAAFTGGAMVLPTFGFAAGFERYGVLDPWINDESPRTRALLAGLAGAGERGRAANSLAAIESTLANFGDAPWFLFAHTYAAHEFDPPQRHLEAIDAGDGRPATDPDILRFLATPEPPPEELRERLAELYAAGVRHADEFLGALLDLVEARGESDHTVVVVVSDHGKELAEHGAVAHGHALYEALVSIPILIAVPGREAQVLGGATQLVDVLPTLAPIFDLELPGGLQGRDLFDSSADPNRAQWAELDGVIRIRALRLGDVKTIEDLRDPDASVVYDLAADPGERAPQPADAETLARLDQFARQLSAVRAGLPSESLASSELDADDLAQLRALGYMVGADGEFIEED